MRTELTLTPATFDCDRTCPMHETKTADGFFDCRFRPLLDQIGTTRVESHTVKVKTTLDDPRALESAVKALGWKWLGAGRHSLYGGQSENGHGFKIPNWTYPCIMTDAGNLAYDNFNENWGNSADLEQLKTAYLTAKVESSANELGWLSERTAQGITVFHPDGGRIDVANNGVCETTGFSGTGCHTAREQLGLRPDGESTNKQEIDNIAAVTQLPS